MKKTILIPPGVQELNEVELTATNGGEIPGKGTSLANDLAYYAAYGFRVLWAGLKDGK
ncbi:hypothetical protein D9M68_628940 [compost metagenome]